MDHLSRLVQVAQANLKDAQDAVETAKKQVATDQEIKDKAVASLEAAKKSLSEKTTALNEIKAKHDAGAKTLAELNQKRTQAETALADATKRSARFGKGVGTHRRRGKENSSRGSASGRDRGRAGQNSPRSPGIFPNRSKRDAQSALDASTKERDAAQAAQDALAKQVDEAQKALDAATAANRDAETTLSRAEESIVGSNKVG